MSSLSFGDENIDIYIYIYYNTHYETEVHIPMSHIFYLAFNDTKPSLNICCKFDTRILHGK